MNTKNQTIETAYKNRWKALLLLCTAQFMVIMDTSIIGVALPAIKNALGYSQTGLQWIFNAYVIFLGGLLLLGGKLSDLYGSRKIFMAGFVVLTGASLLAGLAWSEGSMNAGRALQGLGSALIAPAAMTLIMTTFTDPKELGKAFGLWGASAAAGGSAGVFLGGVITQWMSWRWVFLINIPIGLVVLMFSTTYLLKGIGRKGKVDYIGGSLITSSLVLMVFAIVTAENGLLNFATIAQLALSVALLVAFFIVQRKQREPLIPLSIFRVPNLSAGNIVMGLMAASWIPLWFFLNLYLQQILQFSAFKSGLALLPMTIVIMILMVGFTGKLVAKFGFKKNLVAGLLLLSVSLFIFSLAPVEGTFVGNLLLPSLLAAMGMSLAYIPGTIASMSGAKPEETGLASGLVNTSYQIGSALGLAIIVAISNTKTKIDVAAGMQDLPALNGGFQSAFIVAGVVALISSVLAMIFIKAPKNV